MRERIALWKRIFDTDDNAITKQVSKLAWDLAAFTCLVEVVRRAPDAGNGKRLNGMLMDMMATGFWSTTLQGVRKLAETMSIHGRYGVCSIGGLLQDIQDVRHRLTRRVFVEDIAGVEYDYEATRARYWQWAMEGEPGPRWVPREYHYEISEQRHKVFDWLSGTTPETRTPDDVVREQVFIDLAERLKQLDAVVEHVNVAVAHAATEASRAGRVLDRWNLDDAKSAIKELAQIAELVGSWFCFSGVGTVLPVPQSDQFEHLDQPLYQGDVAALREVWDRLSDEMEHWHEIDPTVETE
ncbi:MAG: hypothetical protein ACTHOC_01830 [Luteimonas sp.]